MDKKNVSEILKRIQSDLQIIKHDSSVSSFSALYGFLFTASYSVGLAIEHLCELNDAKDRL